MFRCKEHAIRITPAYAGSTVDKNCNDAMDQDHPRIRGKYYCSSLPSSSPPGSPPHTREVLCQSVHTQRMPGITPAYAGSTHTLHQYAVSSSGSPPHTREVLSKSGLNVKHGRITPAYAGSTVLLCFPASQPEDHPRIRGKYGIRPISIRSHRGSPPHTREVLFDLFNTNAIGITSAYAGSTKQLSVDSGQGSLSRIRGKYPDNSPAAVFPSGSLPAYAGSTRPPLLQEPLRPGSPPHTREVQAARSICCVTDGTAPAYAGSTIAISVD